MVSYPVTEYDLKAIFFQSGYGGSNKIAKEHGPAKRQYFQASGKQSTKESIPVFCSAQGFSHLISNETFLAKKVLPTKISPSLYLTVSIIIFPKSSKTIFRRITFFSQDHSENQFFSF